MCVCYSSTLPCSLVVIFPSECPKELYFLTNPFSPPSPQNKKGSSTVCMFLLFHLYSIRTPGGERETKKKGFTSTEKRRAWAQPHTRCRLRGRFAFIWQRLNASPGVVGCRYQNSEPAAPFIIQTDSSLAAAAAFDCDLPKRAFVVSVVAQSVAHTQHTHTFRTRGAG